MRDSGKWISAESGNTATLIWMDFMPVKGTRSEPVMNTGAEINQQDHLKLKNTLDTINKSTLKLPLHGKANLIYNKYNH